MAGKTGTAQVRVYTKEEHARGITKNAALDWKLRDHGLFIGFAPVDAAQICHAPASSSMARDGHPQVLMARDILLFAQKRDPLGMPTAYPVQRRRRRAPTPRQLRRKQAADGASPLCRRQAHACPSPTSCWK